MAREYVPADWAVFYMKDIKKIIDENKEKIDSSNCPQEKKDICTVKQVLEKIVKQVEDFHSL